MVRVLSDVPLEESAVRRLEALPGVSVRLLPPHEKAWELPGDLLGGTAVLLCRWPPGNLDALADLRLLQLSTVGYEHLRHLGLAGRPFRVCNARGVFDTA